MFKAVDGKPYFTSQWYYRPRDTVRIKKYFQYRRCSCLIFSVVDMFDSLLPHPSKTYLHVQVMKDHGDLLEDKRVFLSEMKDDNPLGCLIERLTIAKVPLNVWRKTLSSLPLLLYNFSNKVHQYFVSG